jgi:hypothetical protein
MYKPSDDKTTSQQLCFHPEPTALNSLPIKDGN